MSDTARAAADDVDGEPDSHSSTVPAIGTVLSAVTIAALLVPVRRGVDDPAVWLAAATAVVVAGAFLGRRHGFVTRRVAGAVAAGASVLVVVLSGYAITQGVLGSTAIPGTDASISLLFLAFFVSSGTIGVGVAEFAGISTGGLKERLGHVVEMTAVAFLSLFAIAIVYTLLVTPVFAAVGEPTSIQSTLLEYLSHAIALGAVAIGYLSMREDVRSYIDLERPSLRTIGWIAGGLGLILGANLTVSWIMTVTGIESSEHQTVQQALANPELLLIIIPAMVLIVGPFEELLYRNVIQKSLYDTFSRPGAIVVASVVFAGVHLSAYATAGAGRILASLATLFVLSLILGAIYERTDNLVVPALVHGCYNAVVFLVAFA